MQKTALYRILLLLPAALFACLLQPVEAGTKTMETPSGNALEPISSAGVSAFVKRYVDRHMADAHAPGLVVTVVYGGEVILAEGYGMADLGENRPMTAQTNLRAGSVSKPVTSAAVLELAARGAIALDQPVSAYLSDLPPADRFGPSGTVAQFLTLQGGYADTVVKTHAPTLAQWQPLDVYLREQLPTRIMPPGKVLSYNSWEHALLGQMLAEQTGLAFDQAVAELLLRPLGMTQSTFAQPIPDSIAANLAKGYAFHGAYEEVPLDYVNLTPGIGLVTTGADMGRFLLALLSDGRLDDQQVLAPATVEGMLTRQEVIDPRSRSRSYGFSEVTLGQRDVLYHDGNGIGHGNRIILAPEHGLGIFLSVNHRPLAHDTSSTPAYAFMKDLGTALLQRYLPPSVRETGAFLMPLPDAAARAARYAGHYRLASTPQEDFFKLGALLDNVDVRDSGDGTLAIGSKRYGEVAPRLFQSRVDPDFYVVFAEDDGGEVGWLAFGGTASYQKVRWYETPNVQLVLTGIMLLGFLAFVVLMPFSGVRHWPIWLIGVLGLAFLGGLAYMMTQADLVVFFKTVPAATTALFLVPWLIGGLALAYPGALADLARSQPGPATWLLYGLHLAATGSLLWFVHHWNLFWRIPVGG